MRTRSTDVAGDSGDALRFRLRVNSFHEQAQHGIADAGFGQRIAPSSRLLHGESVKAITTGICHSATATAGSRRALYIQQPGSNERATTGNDGAADGAALRAQDLSQGRFDLAATIGVAVILSRLCSQLLQRRQRCDSTG
jgi:hypothetical protein